MSDRYDSKFFAVQLASKLRADSEPAPTRVVTRLRIRTEETDREFQKCRQNANSVPRYVFGNRRNLPLHPSLQAIGSHCFSW
jgi:hypothetical protein